jgi:hypothetical protein
MRRLMARPMMLTGPAPVISRPLAGRCGQCLGLHGVLSRPAGEPTKFRLGRDHVIGLLDGYGMRPEDQPGAARYRFVRLA